ncbi:MAG: tetrahydromethanopterin S-methyltransferase subunit C [Thermoproteota archaeon]
MKEIKRISINPNKLMVIGLICGLIGSYVGIVNNDVAGVLAGVLAIPVIIWGADAVRRIASYGLGTGVPSIGNLSSGMGLLSALVGLAYQPILGVLLAAIAGAVYGIFVAKFKILEIPKLQRYTTELSMASSLILMCLVSCAIGYYDPLPAYGFAASTMNIERIFKTLFATGFVAPIFWITSVSILHPFNAGLGAGERQGRTLRIGIVTSGMALTLTGLVRAGYLAISGASTSSTSYYLSYITIAIGAIVWLCGLVTLIKTATKEAGGAMWTGIPQKVKK